MPVPVPFGRIQWGELGNSNLICKYCSESIFNDNYHEQSGPGYIEARIERCFKTYLYHDGSESEYKAHRDADLAYADKLTKIHNLVKRY